MFRRSLALLRTLGAALVATVSPSHSPRVDRIVNGIKQRKAAGLLSGAIERTKTTVRDLLRLQQPIQQNPRKRAGFAFVIKPTPALHAAAMNDARNVALSLVANHRRKRKAKLDPAKVEAFVPGGAKALGIA